MHDNHLFNLSKVDLGSYTLLYFMKSLPISKIKPLRVKKRLLKVEHVFKRILMALMFYIRNVNECDWDLFAFSSQVDLLLCAFLSRLF